jgi:hypothetical protein|tara:strand:+ start:372 stop:578 length:207 start_codon:yes stop_codon:yes gene_type:complete
MLVVVLCCRGIVVVLCWLLLVLLLLLMLLSLAVMCVYNAFVPWLSSWLLWCMLLRVVHQWCFDVLLTN